MGQCVVSDPQPRNHLERKTKNLRIPGKGFIYPQLATLPISTSILETNVQVQLKLWQNGFIHDESFVFTVAHGFSSTSILYIITL